MTEPNKAVFLSYASQDAEPAARICAALRAAGVEVWFDQSELRGGDAWDMQIRRQIRDCALFIPIISGYTQQRPEGYFRLEWDLADQRTHMVSRSKAFIVPVCIDGTSDGEADVPESFLKVQWTRLPGGDTPTGFCERIRGLLGAVELPASASRASVPATRTVAPRRHRSWTLVAVAGVLVAVGGSHAYFTMHDSRLKTDQQMTGATGARAAARGETLPLPDERSIAVLPFVNLSADSGQAFFSDGVAEEILNLLANVPGLRVTSRTSSFSFRGQQLDLKTIARHLGVSYIVEGSVQSAGGRVQVTAQLIDVASDAQLWSQSYERKLEDVFAIQSDVAGQIAHSLKIAMGADEAATLGRRPTQDFEAWQLFLKAREQMLGRRSAGDLHAALSNVESALQQDPGFARAHSLRALILATLTSWDPDTNAEGIEANRAADQEWAAALQSAARALRLDPRLGEPYAVRALYAVAHNEFADAEHNFREALIRAPGNADAHNWYGQFLLSAGYLSKGLAEARRAGTLDPLSPLIAWQAAFAGLMSQSAGPGKRVFHAGAGSRWGGPEPAALRGGAAMRRGDMEHAEKIFLSAFPSRSKQIRMSFAAIRQRRIDAPTRAMLGTLVAYGPPGLARFPVEAQLQDADAMLATLYGTVAKDSLLTPSGSGGPARPSDPRASDNVGVLAADWWMPAAAAMRRDPRFAQFAYEIGLVRFWRVNGWPDLCGPGINGIVCR